MKKVLRVLLIAFGLLLLVCFSFSLFSYGIHIGDILNLAASLVLITYGLFFERLIRIKWLTYLICAGAAFVLLLTLFIGIYGKTDTADFNEDAVIVLGAGIRGEKVTQLLSYRLDKAVEYNIKNPDAVIVVSGGQGPGESITEAAAMERYLLARGVPAERIIKEETATSTYENLLLSKAVLDGLLGDTYETVVITNEFHIYRASALAGDLGYTAKRYHAKIDWIYMPQNYLRECLAVIKMWITGK